MRIIDADIGDRGLARWGADPQFPSIDSHPFTGGFGRGYYPAVYGDRRRNITFAVGKADRPLLVVPCTIGEGSLDWYGMPIRMHLATALEPAQQEDAVGEAMQRLTQTIKTNAVERCVVEDEVVSSELSPLGAACLAGGWRGAPAFRGECDLAEGEAGLRKGLRKSSRSLVNWGKRNMALEYVNASRPDRDLFEAYIKFHLVVAGRRTRPAASWNAMFDWIVAGGGELTLGRLPEGELVAATLVVDGRSVAYYASGVYDRERFDKPMAHYPLYDAILRAGARGLRIFDLGALPQAGEASAKEQAIGYFKRGFAGRIQTSITWTWTGKAAPTGGDP